MTIHNSWTHCFLLQVRSTHFPGHLFAFICSCRWMNGLSVQVFDSRVFCKMNYWAAWHASTLLLIPSTNHRVPRNTYKAWHSSMDACARIFIIRVMSFISRFEPFKLIIMVDLVTKLTIYGLTTNKAHHLVNFVHTRLWLRGVEVCKLWTFQFPSSMEWHYFAGAKDCHIQKGLLKKEIWVYLCLSLSESILKRWLNF